MEVINNNTATIYKRINVDKKTERIDDQEIEDINDSCEADYG